MKAAQSVDAPVIIQASRGARTYAGDIMLSHMVKALSEMYPSIPICMHQDHGNNEATCFSANLFKEILVANKDAESGYIEVSEAGLARVTFTGKDYSSTYYLVQLQAA